MSKLLTVETSHALIAYRESDGQGLPVLMIHGNSTCHQVFQNQLEGSIGSTYRCIAIDLPGHGDSGDAYEPDRTYHIGGYSDVAVELMETLGITRYAVFGWSLGGHIALDITAVTDRLCGVIITGSPPIEQGFNAINEGFEGFIEHSIASKQVLTDDEINIFATNTCGANAPYDDFLKTAVTRCDGRSRSLMIAKLACGIGRNQKSLATHSAVPLAIVNGADDVFIRNDYIANLLYTNLWEDQVFDLPKTGHAPFWEDPDTFDQYLHRFLNSLS